MRTLFTLSTLSTLALALAACGDADDDSAPGDGPAPLSDCRAEDGDPLTIDAVTLSGDMLSVDVSHAGGCETHAYAACWPDQSFMESEPVQVNLEVWHDANGDACEAMLSRTLMVDLAPLRDAWRDSYGQESGSIVVNLGGEQVLYSF